MPGLDERADALYALPLDRFTAERDALAKALKADGDKDAAAEVKRLAKPTQAAWAVNAAIREDPQAAEALVEAARTLADAQQELLGGGDAAALRAAATQARAAVDALLDAAPARGAAVDKVRATLHAATVDPEVLEEVAAGRVLRERAASGFGGLEGVTPAKRDDAGHRDGRRPGRAREAHARRAPPPREAPPRQGGRGPGRARAGRRPGRARAGRVGAGAAAQGGPRRRGPRQGRAAAPRARGGVTTAAARSSSVSRGFGPGA